LYNGIFSAEWEIFNEKSFTSWNFLSLFTHVDMSFTQ
jgi:hypothetical protein